MEGGQLHTELGRWRLPSDAGVSCMKGEYCSVEETSLLSDYIDIIIR